ncbi:hypothetical protein NE236_41610 [Actinoallomurus purpureus]|uniref:hypothetical protein n=1 Tax=Actinoallomurus purpureus TaxID=478114 RepID=UPI0020939FDC|nr:hypothetical protein [Actinoallomurus purpureus]MCO6011467.1 hypothetical protein [Actinoallomurus purpureus]
MKPLQRRAPLPPNCWWIVRIDRRRRLVVILDVAVPAGSVAEEYLTRAALKAWREHRRNVVLYTPAAALGVMLLVGAAGVLVLVLAGSTLPLPGPVERPDAVRPAPGPVSREAGSRPAAGPPGSVLARPRSRAITPTSPVASSSPVSVVPVERTSSSSLPVTVVVPRPRPVRHVRGVLPSPVALVRPCELLGLPVGHCVRR